MAGKSAYLRTAATLAVVAHCGCFVPADAAELTPLDALLSRMGAADDVASGWCGVGGGVALARALLALGQGDKTEGTIPHHHSTPPFHTTMTPPSATLRRCPRSTFEHELADAAEMLARATPRCATPSRARRTAGEE